VAAASIRQVHIKPRERERVVAWARRFQRHEHSRLGLGLALHREGMAQPFAAAACGARPSHVANVVGRCIRVELAVGAAGMDQLDAIRGPEAGTGRELPIGAKPFVDDGNTFIRRGGVPAITHGPDAKGAHTLNEEVSVDELVRVATVYALAAIGFCAP